MTLNAVAAPHLLLVDDNPDQLRLLVEVLKEEAYRITIAFDGLQGYARAVAMRPDLILLDVRMPRADGFAVARMLKANPETEHIPILFLSSSAELDQRLTGLRSGAVDYIVKPFQPKEVVERVRIHLELALKQRVANAGELSDDSQKKASAGIERVAEKSGAAMEEETLSSGEKVLLRAARRLVFERLDNPPSAAELAKELGVSERRVMSAFSAGEGMSFFEFIRRERMKKASRLLIHTGLPIIDIAAEVGYSSAANFSTAFREYYDVTPSKYRKR